jgi:histidinol dehydrogenase
MEKELQKILITANSANFAKKISALRKNVSSAATFDITETEGGKTARIISDVRKQGDKAVSRYTLAFDKVKLTPAQFKISSK